MPGVSIMPGVIFLVSIWSLYFNLSQFSPNFCKNEQFLQEPRIGELCMRRLAAMNSPPGGFWKISKT